MTAPFSRMNIGEPDSMDSDTDNAATLTNRSDAMVGAFPRTTRVRTSISGTEDAKASPCTTLAWNASVARK